MMRVSVQVERFDPGAELASLEGEGVGAIASFIGMVRGDGGLTELFLEHYPAMTETALRGLAQGAADRWNLSAVTLIHRVGVMHPGDAIVLVATASPHRAAALESCAFLIDRLKTDAPFWKKETFGNDGQWVDARDSDVAAADRWKK